MGAQQIQSYLRLHLAGNVGAKTFRRLVEAFGGVEGAVAAGPGAWRNIKGIGPKTVEKLSAVGEAEIDEELTEAGRRGARILTLEDED